MEKDQNPEYIEDFQNSQLKYLSILKLKHVG